MREIDLVEGRPLIRTSNRRQPDGSYSMHAEAGAQKMFASAGLLVPGRGGAADAKIDELRQSADYDDNASVRGWNRFQYDRFAPQCTVLSWGGVASGVLVIAWAAEQFLGMQPTDKVPWKIRMYPPRSNHFRLEAFVGLSWEIHDFARQWGRSEAQLRGLRSAA